VPSAGSREEVGGRWAYASCMVEIFAGRQREGREFIFFANFLWSLPETIPLFSLLDKSSLSLHRTPLPFICRLMPPCLTIILVQIPI
jgi:hypothetical protein